MIYTELASMFITGLSLGVAVATRMYRHRLDELREEFARDALAMRREFYATFGAVPPEDEPPKLEVVK